MLKQSSRTIIFAFLGFFILFFWINMPQLGSRPVPLPSPTPPITRVRTTPVPYVSPTPLPLQKADSDIPIRLSLTNEYVIIPKGSTYKTDNVLNLTIYPTDNLSVFMCWGCQPISVFNVCGEGFGMSGEGDCQSTPVTIGDWHMTEYYFTADKSFAFIAGPTRQDMGKSGSDFITIHTQNNQFPTSDEL